MLVTYGLTKQEESELRALLKQAVPGAVLKGMVDLEPAKNGDNFVVTSGTLSDQGFAPTGILTSGRAPTVAGTKAAIAGRVSATGAQLLEATFDNTTSDLSVTFVYDYIAKTPAYRATVNINLDRINEVLECEKHQKSTNSKVTGVDFGGAIRNIHTLGIWGSPLKRKKIVTEEHLQEAYKSLLLTGAVTIKIDQDLPDVDVTEIENSFMSMAMESFSNMQRSFTDEKQADKPDDEGKDGKKSNTPKGDNWKVYTLTRKREKLSGVVTFTMEKGVAVYRTHAMTGNMGGFLREHKDEIFDEVILNDPFFKRGKVWVDMDVEALDLFDKHMVNNASIEVVVPRDGKDYKNTDVFTKTDFSEGRVTTEFTFASGKTDGGVNCPFKYMETWSLKGGGKWPKVPQLKCSSAMSITLVPPIEAHTVDVEADLNEMESAGIPAADVQLRYNQYGKSKTETVKFRVVKGENYQEKTVFVDKERPSIEYRLVLVSKNGSKIDPSPWQKLEGEFVYANLSGLPTSYLDKLRKVIPGLAEILQ